MTPTLTQSQREINQNNRRKSQNKRRGWGRRIWRKTFQLIFVKLSLLHFYLFLHHISIVNKVRNQDKYKRPKSMINLLLRKLEVIILLRGMPKHSIMFRNTNHNNVIGLKKMTLEHLQQFGIFMMLKLLINWMNLNNCKRTLKVALTKNTNTSVRILISCCLQNWRQSKSMQKDQYWERIHLRKLPIKQNLLPNNLSII
jgi:hypothetical protein